MITAIIQARMASTRLPGKVLRPLAGKPVVMHIVERARAVRRVQHVVVATSTSAADDILVDELKMRGVASFRGSENDVLGRYGGTARACDASVVVRLTADDPLKDPAVIGRVLDAYLAEPDRWDYVSNTNPPSWPEGQDTEVFAAAKLFEIDCLASDSFSREHVTPYFYRNPDRYRCLNIRYDQDLSAHRWTLDTEADWRFLEAVHAALPGDRLLGLDDVLDLLARRPDIRGLNAEVARSHAYR
jgi:spore coat polysaccharide biosynthesis protein SpsF